MSDNTENPADSSAISGDGTTPRPPQAEPSAAQPAAAEPAVADSAAASQPTDSAPASQPAAPVEPTPTAQPRFFAPPAQPVVPAQPVAPTQPVAPAQPTQPAYGQYAPGQTSGQTSAQPTPQTQPTQPFVQPLSSQNPNTPRPDYGNGSFGQPFSSGTTYGPDGRPVLVDAPPAKRRGGAALVAALAIGALIGGASGAGISVWALSQNSSSSSAPAASAQTITVNNPDNANLITAVAAKASPSVVTLSVSDGSTTSGTGSGVILSADGYVLTNTHVVTLDGATATPTISVKAADGKIYAGTVVGTDPVADLAVVKLQDASGLTPIEFGDSSTINVGDTAIAIGAPLGLSGTVTNGIVSSLNRSITVASSAAPDSSGEQVTPSPDSTGSPYDFWNFDIPGQGGTQSQPTTANSAISLAVIQTDAAINPGNSGGALLDSEGKLIGINVAIASAGSSSSSSGQSGSIGVGFSIPANFAKRISDEIIANGKATHGLLGASISQTDDANQTVAGATVADVTSGGAAAAAGLQKGDIITSFNSIPITDATDITAQVRVLPAGATAPLTYVRGGNATTVTVTLGQLAS